MKKTYSVLANPLVSSVGAQDAGHLKRVSGFTQVAVKVSNCECIATTKPTKFRCRFNKKIGTFQIFGGEPAMIRREGAETKVGGSPLMTIGFRETSLQLEVLNKEEEGEGSISFWG